MARRTKKQKMLAEERRGKDGAVTYSFAQVSASFGVSEKPVVPQSKAADLFGYDVRLIYRDLLKTIVITFLILTALFVISRSI